MLRTDIFYDEGSGDQREEAADGDSYVNVSGNRRAGIDRSLFHNKELEAYFLVLHSLSIGDLLSPDNYLLQGNALLFDSFAFN